MKDGSMINNREIARRFKISENSVNIRRFKIFENTLKTFKMIGGIQSHAGSGRLKKLRSAKTVLYFVK